MNRLERFMHEERYMRNGNLMLNLLRYDIQWVVGRWGFLKKEEVKDFFKLVVDMFEKDLLQNSNTSSKIKEKNLIEETKAKNVSKSKQDTLPSEDMFVNANTNKK